MTVYIFLKMAHIQHLKHIEKHLTHLSELGQMDDTTKLFNIQEKIKEYEY